MPNLLRIILSQRVGLLIAISALCGNMSGESTLNPNLYEQGYNHSLSRGYGLVQWTPATKLMDWCNANSLSWSDGDAQLIKN
jgi:hypothetical protein